MYVVSSYKTKLPMVIIQYMGTTFEGELVVDAAREAAIARRLAMKESASETTAAMLGRLSRACPMCPDESDDAPSSSSLTSSRFRLTVRRLMVLFQWFLTALSVLPGSNLAISAHLLPIRAWASLMIFSSASDHGVFLMSGCKWLCQLLRWHVIIYDMI